MVSPFPGMDPYLESPAVWFDFHWAFIVYLSEYLNAALPEQYYAGISEQMYSEKPPSPELNVVSMDRRKTLSTKIVNRRDETLVAVLEMLSPITKENPGRAEYLDKRNALARQPVHLVELDLLIGGQRLPFSEHLPPAHYYAVVSRADRRPGCEVYAWTLRQPFPTLPIPLKAPDPDLQVDLGSVFRMTMDRGQYERRLRYNVPVPVELPEEEMNWIRETARAWKR